jgi:hypothetical protein
LVKELAMIGFFICDIVAGFSFSEKGAESVGEEALPKARLLAPTPKSSWVEDIVL